LEVPRGVLSCAADGRLVTVYKSLPAEGRAGREFWCKELGPPSTDFTVMRAVKVEPMKGKLPE